MTAHARAYQTQTGGTFRRSQSHYAVHSADWLARTAEACGRGVANSGKNWRLWRSRRSLLYYIEKLL